MVSQNYRFFPAVRAVQSIMSEKRSRRAPAHRPRFSPAFAAEPGRSPLATETGTNRSFWTCPSTTSTSCVRSSARADFVDCRTTTPSWAGLQGPPGGDCYHRFRRRRDRDYRGSWLHPGPKTLWAGEWRMEFEKVSSGGPAEAISSPSGRTKPGCTTTMPSALAVDLPHLQRVDRAGALDAFVTARVKGTEPESSGRENIGSLVLAHAAVESSCPGAGCQSQRGPRSAVPSAPERGRQRCQQCPQQLRTATTTRRADMPEPQAGRRPSCHQGDRVGTSSSMSAVTTRYAPSTPTACTSRWRRARALSGGCR